MRRLSVVRAADQAGRRRARGGGRAHGGLTREQLFHDSMPLRDWLRIAIPPNLGASAFDPRLEEHFIPIVYIGALTILFALIGVIVARRRGLGWIALIAICVLIGV